MRSLKTRLKDMLAMPTMAPVIQSARILEASYEPMETKTLLLRANKATKAENVDFNHCTITFEFENGDQGTLTETRRVFRLVDTNNRPRNISSGNAVVKERYQNRRPGQIINVALDYQTGEWYLTS